MSNKQGTVGPVAFTVIGLLALLPILYVLSSGPAVGLVARDYISQDTIEVVYSPLDFVCQRCTPFEQAMSWYVDLFQPVYEVPPGTIYDQPFEIPTNSAPPNGATPLRMNSSIPDSNP